MNQNFNLFAKVIIVDDDVLICETIKDNLLEMGFKNLKMTHSLEDFYSLLAFWTPDLVLLDIRLENNEDGILIGKELSKRKISYIYISAQNDVEITKKIIETNPSGFISKPIKMHDFMISIGLVMNELSNKSEEVIKVKQKGELISLFKKDIEYIQSFGNYLEVNTTSARISIRSTIEHFLLELNDDRFSQVHRSIIVNNNKIQKVGLHNITMFSGTCLPVSKTFSRNLKEV